MKTFIALMAVLLLSGCSLFNKKPEPPEIRYERTSFGLPVACVIGEVKCRELSEEKQKQYLQDILEAYGVVLQ